MSLCASIGQLINSCPQCSSKCWVVTLCPFTAPVPEYGHVTRTVESELRFHVPADCYSIHMLLQWLAPSLQHVAQFTFCFTGPDSLGSHLCFSSLLSNPIALDWLPFFSEEPITFLELCGLPFLNSIFTPSLAAVLRLSRFF